MIYGYARVSTKKQLEGNGLEVQEKAMMAAGADKVIKEQYTGTAMKRPKLDALLEQMTEGDTLMAAKLDRIARTAAEGAEVIRSLQERGVAVHILNIGVLDSSTTGRLMTNVLLAFAEFERDLIVERTQAGREVARTHAGYREGRRPLPQARKDAAVVMIRNGQTYREACAATGLSRSTILRAVQAARAQHVISCSGSSIPQKT